jgi:hypothetical protein
VARQITIGRSPCVARVRNPWAVLALSLVPFYALVWWYAINRELRDLGRVHARTGFGERPGLSALAFSGASVLTLFVALVWTVVATMRRIRRAQDLVGTSERLNVWTAAALWILTLGFGGIVYAQRQLNEVWLAQEPSTAREPGPLGGADSGELVIEDPEQWPAEHPATWDAITRRAYTKRYGKQPGS